MTRDEAIKGGLSFSGKETHLDVLFDTVSIKIVCENEYEAQVLFDDLAERLQAGQSIAITLGKKP